MWLLSHFSSVRFFVTLWTVAHQAPLSMGFSRQEYWSGLPFPPPGDLRNPGIEPRSPELQADSLPSEPPGKVKVKVKSLSRVRLFVTPWTVAYQAPLSMRFSRQEYWSGLLFPSPGHLSNPGIKHEFLASPELVSPYFKPMIHLSGFALYVDNC